MTNGFPYWQFHNERWLTGKVASFDLDAQGLFLQFCMAAWAGHGVFNICSTSVRLRFRKTAEWVTDTVAAMLEVGILVRDGDAYRIKFIDQQFDAMMESRGKKSKAGKASAEARAGSPTPPPDQESEKSNNTRVTTALNIRSTGVEQVLNAKQEPDPTKPTDREFDFFWNAWPKHPRKVNRAGCLKIWQKRGLKSEMKAIMTGLNAWKRSDAWMKDGGQYIPNVQTWLNRNQWQDLEAAAASTNPGEVNRYVDVRT